MERHQHGLPVINHLLQHTLRSICTDSQWVYAVFWRILPRNYPPPKWDNETGFLDRSKGNKRNWILTWEDGFCDFNACAKANKTSSDGSNDGVTECLQPELFFKMSHEVYSYGEGLMGKVASDSSHKWIFKDPSEQDSSFVSPWHGSLDPHPRTWESQFKAGIQTIAIVAVQEGLLQLGSLEKVFEDLNLVILLQRKFTYLQSIPGVFAPHPNTFNYMRPRLPLHHHHGAPAAAHQCHHRLNYGMLDDSFIGLSEQQRLNLLGLASRPPAYQNFQDNNNNNNNNGNPQLLAGLKRTCSSELTDEGTTATTTASNTTSPNGRQIPERPPLSKSLNTGHSPPGVVPPLQPSMSSLHALLSKLPSVSSLLGPTTTTTAGSSAAGTSSSPMHQTSTLSRSLSMPRQFTNQLHLNEDYPVRQQPQQGPDGELTAKSEAPHRNTHNLTCRTGSTGGSTPSTKMSIMPDASKGYLEHFENVSDYGIHSELDAYNTLLSEIHQLI